MSWRSTRTRCFFTSTIAHTSTFISTLPWSFAWRYAMKLLMALNHSRRRRAYCRARRGCWRSRTTLPASAGSGLHPSLPLFLYQVSLHPLRLLHLSDLRLWPEPHLQLRAETPRRAGARRALRRGLYGLLPLGLSEPGSLLRYTKFWEGFGQQSNNWLFIVGLYKQFSCNLAT